jgi:hypothetical protein
MQPRRPPASLAPPLKSSACLVRIHQWLLSRSQSFEISGTEEQREVDAFGDRQAQERRLILKP